MKISDRTYDKRRNAASSLDETGGFRFLGFAVVVQPPTVARYRRYGVVTFGVDYYNNLARWLAAYLPGLL
jgi:hypothetical protein